MHSSTPAEHLQESTHTVAAGVATEVALSGTGAIADLASIACDCESQSTAPVHSMLVAACILALLATMLVLIPPVASTLTFGALRRIAASSAWLRGALALPRPPSLLVLSISRT